MPTPQFGEPGLEGPYPDRPVAFAVIAHEARIAVVEVDRIHRGLVLDLPGGGLDPGETAAQAAVRECGGRAGEDAALKIEDDHRLVWLDPHEAVVRLDRESHAWAVAAWLRLRARA